MRKYRRRTPIQAPHAHPLVQWLFKEMHRQQIGTLDLTERAGLSKHTLRDWTRRHNPSLMLLEAALGVVGYQLVLTKKPEPEEPRERLSRGRVR